MAFFTASSHKKWVWLSCLAVVAAVQPFGAGSAAAKNETPSLIVTNAPLPQILRDKIYSTPHRVREITPNQIAGEGYVDGGETAVAQKVSMMEQDLRALQRNIDGLSGSIAGVRRDAEARSADYYANIATINTQLRAGTTPGNPRLVSRLSMAEANLEDLSQVVAHLNNEAVRVSKAASEATFLLESVQATYGLSGAVEEDHVKLAEVEDQVNGTVVIIERLLNNVNDDITRTTAYLSTERNNLRTLALAVSNGSLYGGSLSNRPFATAGAFSNAAVAATPDMQGYNDQGMVQQASVPAERRALVKIKFDQPDVSYEQALYVAVNEALERYPQARFDVVAVNPTQGNAAQVAIETTRARRNAERVLRTLTQMGLPMERINVSSDESAAARSSEVHVFVQ